MKKILVMLLMISCIGCKKISNTMTFMVEYNYGGISFKVDLQTNEKIPTITVLYNSSYFTFDLGKFKIPNNLIPGDTITIEYIGELYTLTSYPGQIVLNGELLNLEVNYTNIIEIENENIVRNENGGIKSLTSYSYIDSYVVLDHELNYLPLDDYTNEKLYGSYNSLLMTEENSYPIGAFFAYNPRN